MKHAVKVFTARDLRNRAGGLLREAAQGRLSLITKHGRPVALTVPFNDLLLEQGVPRHLAVRLFTERLATLAQAAKIANQSIEEFLGVLGATHTDVVDYPPEELKAELAALK